MRMTVWCVVIATALGSSPGLTQPGLTREHSSRASPNDYLLRSFENPKDPIFDGRTQTIDLGIDLGIGADCGKVDVRGTMRSALKNMLDARYFGNLGQTILAASPMLATCYFSPTWCAILKHSQLSAHYLSQLRLDQCSLIDKYTDQRSEDFYRERQNCVRRKISGEDGDLESAMDSCRDVYGVDLTSWSGRPETTGNKLIESSAAWAGLSGEESKRTVDLAKAFVGDTVVSRGRLSVEYGPEHRPLTPETHLKALQKEVQEKVCDGLLRKVVAGRRQKSVEQLVSDQDLKNAIPSERLLLDRQTLESLAFMPLRHRQEACRKLADVLAVTVLATDLNRSLDVLTVAAQNPNLPPNRRQEIEDKRRALKDSIEITMRLHEQRNDPLTKVLADINRRGVEERGRAADAGLTSDAARLRWERARQTFTDCADGILCERR